MQDRRLASLTIAAATKHGPDQAAHLMLPFFTPKRLLGPAARHAVGYAAGALPRRCYKRSGGHSCCYWQQLPAVAVACSGTMFCLSRHTLPPLPPSLIIHTANHAVGHRCLSTQKEGLQFPTNRRLENCCLGHTRPHNQEACCQHPLTADDSAAAARRHTHPTTPHQHSDAPTHCLQPSLLTMPCCPEPHSAPKQRSPGGACWVEQQLSGAGSGGAACRGRCVSTGPSPTRTCPMILLLLVR